MLISQTNALYKIMFQTCPLCRYKGSTLTIKESYFHENSLCTMKIIIMEESVDESDLDELEEEVMWAHLNFNNQYN